MSKLKFNVSGMSCAACSARVEKVVGAIDGVTDVSVSLLTNSMVATLDDSVSPKDVCKAVSDAGYKATLASDKSAKKEKLNPTLVLLIRLIASIALLIPLMYVSMGALMWNWPLPQSFAENQMAIAGYELALSLVIMIINGRFFVSGTKALLHKAPNMDTLVSMGSGISFVYSVALMIQAGVNPMHLHHLAHNLYFESAAMILALITLGKTLESYSKGKTTSAIKGLMNLAPQTVRVLKDGAETEIPLSDLKQGDLFVVRPGENFAADGVIVSGVGSVNEASVTGESMPVDKTVGSNVVSGTNNIDGFLTIKALKVGDDTTLAGIVKLVEEASSSKAPIAKTADKVSGIFVPSVILVALAVFVVWIAITKNIETSLKHSISVLVISCPCALGLATPVAIMVGNGKGAKNGILFKTATALEEAGKADFVVLDKTGTITKGTPKVTDVLALSDLSKESIILLAARLEQGSSHPIAQAVLSEAQAVSSEAQAVSSEEIVPADDFRNLSGHGLQGSVNGKTVLLGNRSLMSEYNINTDEFDDKFDTLSQDGKTPLYLAYDNGIKGIIAVQDTLKDDSVDAIQALRKQGITTVMLTGDNALCANAVAKKCGIDFAISDVLPEDKDFVLSMLGERGKTIMVGDGVNDAPALTRADVGVAIGAGTDIAIDSADVVLMHSSLSDVAKAVTLSRRTLTNIKENLFWAFIYNVICIPVAAGALSFEPVNITLTPMIGAAAMSLSSVCVVLNALRLNLVNLNRVATRKKRAATLDASDILSRLQDNKKAKTDSISSDVLPADGNAYDEASAQSYNIANQNATQNAATDNQIPAQNVCDNDKGDNNMTKTLTIEGMMCAHCVAHVKKALQSVDGVQSADVSLDDKNAIVTLAKDVDNDVLKAAVIDAGYEVVNVK